MSYELLITHRSLLLALPKDHLPGWVNIGRQIRAKGIAIEIYFRGRAGQGQAAQFYPIRFSRPHLKIGVAGIDFGLEAGKKAVSTARPGHNDLGTRYTFSESITNVDS